MPQRTEKRETESPHRGGKYLQKNCIPAIVLSALTCWLVVEVVLAKPVVTIGTGRLTLRGLCLVLGTEADADKRDCRP